MTDTEWAAKAACRGAEPGLFDAELLRSRKEMTRRIAAAKEICSWCLVRNECLDHAMANGEDDGIWGAMTPAERRGEISLTPEERER